MNHESLSVTPEELYSEHKAAADSIIRAQFKARGEEFKLNEARRAKNIADIRLDAPNHHAGPGSEDRRRIDAVELARQDLSEAESDHNIAQKNIGTVRKAYADNLERAGAALEANQTEWTKQARTEMHQAETHSTHQ